jgi:outer membrane protein assembly complex protein YaeT
LALAVLLGRPGTAGAADEGRYAFRFAGNHHMSDAALRRAAATELEAFVQNEGREADLVDAVFQMTIHYRREGYAFAQVTYAQNRRDDIVLVVFTVEEGPHVLVERIRFEGDVTVPQADLEALFSPAQSIFALSEAPPFVQSEIEAGAGRVRDYYRARGYQDVRVEAPRLTFSDDRTRVTVVIPITEGRRYLLTDLAFTGDRPESVTADLGALRDAMVGQAYNRSLRLVIQSRLEEIYGDQGYADMEVVLDEKRLPAPEGIRLEAAITSGPMVTIDRIEVRGAQKTDPDFIRRRLEFKPGDRYSLTKERESFRALYRTGLFSKVDLFLEDPGPPGQQILVASVTEAPTREFYIEPGWGSYELLRLRLGWREKNPFGGGRNVGLETTVSAKSRQVEANLVDPWFLDTEITADVPLYYNYREEPSFTREDIGLSPSLSSQLSTHISATVAYNLRNTDISDVDPLVALEDLGDDNYNFGSIKLQTTYDDRDDPFYPSRGRRLTFSIEHADSALGGDITFTRLNAGMRYFYSLNPDTVLGLRYATGFIYPGSGETNVPISERFFNGGENSVRSFKESELGPKDLSGNPVGGLAFNTINVELRRRLFGDLSGTLFYDLGNVAPNRSITEGGRRPPENRSDAVSDTLDDFFSDFRSGIGFGLHYKLPIGPVRCDLAWNPDADKDRDEDNWVFHFSVGMAF